MNSFSELLVYKASAGSGKTFTLTAEYIKLLVRDPRAYQSILAVTFTNKATTEMKDRILSQLYGIYIGDTESEAYLKLICKDLEWNEDRVKEAAGKALKYMIHDYSHFRVETIDSFFQSIMRNLAKELELSANLTIELNNYEILGQAVDSMIEKLDRNSPVLVWLLDYIYERIASDKRWKISKEIKNFGKNIFDENYIEKGKDLRIRLQEKDYIFNYSKHLKALREEVLDQMKSFADQFFGILEEAGLSPSDLKNGSRGISSYFSKILNGKLNNDIKNSTVEKCLENEENWCTKSSPYKETILSLATSQLIPLLEECEKYRYKNNIILNSCDLSLRHLNNLRLLNYIDEEVRELNYKNNRFFLSDTNALLHNLVNESDSTFIFEKIGTVIRHIMIDEFQDTSRMQWGNFRILLLEGLSQGANSLIVGDVKQSIYRWRNSDWSILNNMRDKIGAFNIKIKNLIINRRSEWNIIQFNNQIFTAACAYLCEIYRNELNIECEELKEAYQDVCQESLKEEKKGYVKVSFLEENQEADYLTSTLETLVNEVKNLIHQGVELADITILVRKNRYIPVIADFFDKHLSCQIVSDEAFKLSSSVAINIIINSLRCLSNPENRISKAQLAIIYQNTVLKRNMNLNTILLNETESFLPASFVQRTSILRLLPLYELVEDLISIFEINQIEKQDAYLFSFLDAVTEYIQSNSSDLDSFITFWEENLCNKTIPCGEIEGIRIMSIHKSKGLEFHTVLLPFCDWKLENETSNQLVWCFPHETPFDELELVPVNYCISMSQSIYQNDYLNERLQLWVDNLNLLYVAFTRAKNNLVILGKANQRANISELLFNSLLSVSQAYHPSWNGEGNYEVGSICPSEIKKQKATFNKLSIPSRKLMIKKEIYRHQIKFRQFNPSTNFIKDTEDSDKEKNYISQGQLLHTLFSSIKTLEDIYPAIERLLFQGVIESKEKENQIRKITERAFSNPQIIKWYSGDWHPFNECSIIYQANGRIETKRPDRVMIKGDKVIVIEFKFGKRKKEYNEQVKNYMSLLSQMRYKDIEGYLWYVFENQLVKIE